MRYTKNDLSYGNMKIDLQAVYVSVKSAYYARLNRLIDEVTALRNGECDGEGGKDQKPGREQASRRAPRKWDMCTSPASARPLD